MLPTDFLTKVIRFLFFTYLVFCIHKTVEQDKAIRNQNSQTSETRRSRRTSEGSWSIQLFIGIPLLSALIYFSVPPQQWFFELCLMVMSFLIYPLYQCLYVKRWLDASGLFLLLVAYVSFLYSWFYAQNPIIGGVICLLAVIGLWITSSWQLSISFLRR